MNKPKAEVTWENPPPKPVRGKYDWTAIAEQLRQRPGEWAKIFDEDRSSLATAIRIKGIIALHPDKGFVVRTSNNTRGNPRTCSLYLMYDPARDINGHGK